MTRGDSEPDEAAVRHALAAARHTDPMPRQVAARLDDVIADLAAERATPAPQPTQLNSRRSKKRRWTTGLLVAAASVVAAATAPQWWPSSTSSDTVASDRSVTEGSQEPQAEAPQGASAQADSAEKSVSSGAGAAAAQDLPVLTSSRALKPQLRALVSDHRDAPTDLSGTRSPKELSGGKCLPATLRSAGVSRLHLVRLNSDLAWVVERATSSPQPAGTEVLLVTCADAVLTSFVQPVATTR